MSENDRHSAEDGNRTAPRPRDDEIRVRQMGEADLATGLRLSLQVGWNQLEADWRLFYSLNPEGAFVAECGDRVVGTVTTTDYGGRMGWIAMVIVDPTYRHRGIATCLLHTAIGALSHLDTIKLDATPAGRHVYARMEFRDEFCLTRFAAEKISPLPAGECAGHIRPMEVADVPSVVERDTLVLGAERKEVIEGLLSMAPEYAFVWEKESELKGFVMGRHGAKFEFVGPLVAEGVGGARALCRAVLERTGRRPAGMDVPDSAREWRDYVEGLGMTPRRPFTRMYRGAYPLSGELRRLFAGAGPELG